MNSLEPDATSQPMGYSNSSELTPSQRELEKASQVTRFPLFLFFFYFCKKKKKIRQGPHDFVRRVCA